MLHSVGLLISPLLSFVQWTQSAIDLAVKESGRSTLGQAPLDISVHILFPPSTLNSVAKASLVPALAPGIKSPSHTFLILG